MLTTALFPGTECGDELERAVAVRRRIATEEAEYLEHVADYVENGTVDDPVTVVERPGGPRRIQYGGSGTPMISEFVVCEVAPALGIAQPTAVTLVADALDLRYRLPGLYAALGEGVIDAWKVRKAAAATRDFTREQAAEADRRLSHRNRDGVPLLGRIGRKRLRAILEQIRPVLAPEDAEDEVAANLAKRYVDLRPLEPGLGDVYALLSHEDAARLDHRLDSIADSLRHAGDDRPRQVLRSVALGMLADPGLLDRLLAGLDDNTDLDNDTSGYECPNGGDGIGDASETNDDEDGSGSVSRPDGPRSGHEDGDVDNGGEWRVAERKGHSDPTSPFRKTPLPATVLYLHCDRVSGTWLLDGVGPITRGEAIDILGHSRVVIRPVIDLADNPTYSGYVAPPKLKEHTALMNAGQCSFPYCERPARTAEYDHIVDYADGGATDARNGHRLCKHHHRAKTFTDWHVRSPAPGVWLWTSPDARIYLVTAGTTSRLNDHIRRRRREKPNAA